MIALAPECKGLSLESPRDAALGSFSGFFALCARISSSFCRLTLLRLVITFSLLLTDDAGAGSLRDPNASREDVIRF
jgi:hypothetical protein